MNNNEINNLVASIDVKGTQEFMGKEIPVVEGGFGEGKRCLTDKTIAEIHGMQPKNVRARITDNLKRFKEDVDYIDLKVAYDTSNNLELLQSLGYSKMQISKAEHIYLLSAIRTLECMLDTTSNMDINKFIDLSGIDRAIKVTLEKYDIYDSFNIDKKVVEKEFKVRTIKTDTGFVIKNKFNAFRDSSKYRIVNNTDGTTDLLIKNIQYFKEG